MASPLDSFPFDSPTPSLEAGLAALQQQDYQTAIALLSQVSELELDEDRVHHAQMALVKAYHQMGNREKAIALCHILQRSQNPQIQTWVQSTLTQLEKPETQQISASDTPPNPPSPARAQRWKPLPPWTGLATHPKQRLGLQIAAILGIIWVMQQLIRGFAVPLNQLLANMPILEPVGHYLADSTGSMAIAILLTVISFPQLKPRLNQPPLIWGFVQIVTLFVWVWWINWVLQTAMKLTNLALLYLPVVNPLSFLDYNPKRLILLTVAILFAALPSLTDFLLKSLYQLQPLAPETLTQYSPEATRVLQRYCRQQNIPFPKLALLPIPIPVIFAYGNLPRTARIVVSQDFLETLTEAEIAVLFASQAASIAHWDFAILSLGVLFLQIPYLIYSKIAQIGDRLADRIERPFLASIVRAMVAIIANLSYNIYWLLRLPLFPLSRWRCGYSDAEAAALTGNPNALTRALRKIAIAINRSLQTSQPVAFFLDSFELLLPLGYRQAIVLGNYSSNTPLEPRLTWEIENPYRHWLSLVYPHPLIGERLQKLADFARYWRLPPEVDLPASRPQSISWKQGLSLFLKSYKALPLLQSSVIYSLILGGAVRFILWSMGVLAYYLYLGQLVWLSQDQQGDLIKACILLSFSLLLLTRMSGYFPDIKTTPIQSSSDLLKCYYSPTLLPGDHYPVRLEGKLIGRKAIANALGQDLILQFPDFLIKLHYFSPFACFGDIWDTLPHPSALLGRSVTVTGWFRRGATPWIDLDTLTPPSHQPARNYYPLWLTLMALASGLWGAYLIWQT